MEYNFRAIEQKWQQQWADSGAYKVSNESSKPKFYVLDMFPYPSGAGLHVGHPLGYIASDIFARYKRNKGFNVLHPMGYDAFGLPAEQYAIEHGVHPAVSTAKNIATFRSQLDKIGFCFDWSRQVNTSEPRYYKWTQWIFLQLFNSWYNRRTNRTEKIDTLIAAFEKEGNASHPLPAFGKAQADNGPDFPEKFTAGEWKAFDEKTKMAILMEYRTAYCGYGEVNWCEALGTVLANDEVVNGVSERGGYPVIKKRLRQWYLRITEYADRLLEGLQTVDFSDAMKEMQSNWIGKSSGAEIDFEVVSPLRSGEATKQSEGWSRSEGGEVIRVYTTRPDTIFGVDFMVLAPEHDLVLQIASGEQRAAVEEYVAYVKSRSERERMAEKKISGVFTGAYVQHPFSDKKIPVWISEYVLAGYGTGAIMAVPSGDERDHKFARHFNIPITNIWGDAYTGEDAVTDKSLVLHGSDFVNGKTAKEAIGLVIDKLVEKGIGIRKINFRLRDAAFSRQRYWGEPFPIKWIDGVAYPLDESELPLELPYVEKYGPGPEGEGPLANVPEWTAQHLETNTMPGYAGSSWYFLRYMDPHNDAEFCSKKASDYWRQVDLYVGGTEHAVGHLLYSRMWTKCLFDLGLISFDEPFKRLLNQGMIQGSSRFVYRLSLAPEFAQPELDNGIVSPTVLVSKTFVDNYDSSEVQTFLEKKLAELDLQAAYSGVVKSFYQFDKPVPLHVDVNLVDGVELDIEAYRNWKPDFKSAIFILEDGTISLPLGEGRGGVSSESGETARGGVYICGVEVEKMSKSKVNTVNPDVLVEKYGADTFRMYEMFLGPVEMSKPWDTKGIEGVHRFLKKLWRLFYNEGGLQVTNEAPTKDELKTLHKTIRKIEEDTERFSFNTAVSTFMIAVNELTDLKSSKKDILSPLLVLLTPYAPHIAEELWAALGNSDSVLDAPFPKFEAEYLVESSKEYPVSINGKNRTQINIALDATEEQVKEIVLANEIVQKWMEGKPLKKLVFVKGRMVNLVV
ncbi:leucine--tRNA ligase [Flaviaesturariibacter flavus]|uniref:Leucine--tRNA ligase n=1 Tax=Flaviaesturariibacter flavus TaxID=2502780 RepID=A0A4R1BNH8_9BACT|nr:class I tRNA ligase family protein [Flaviaesturariibacter flavus]TCJ18836.1 leucine--tRNA ligase [Flaviaesturariibacter flavus]